MSFLRASALVSSAVMALGALSAAPTFAHEATDPTEPVLTLALTTPTGTPTEVATAGVDNIAAGSGRATGKPLMRGVLSATGDEDVLDPAQDAAILTQPLAVDDFMVTGLTWQDSGGLADSTQMFIRVRENGAWSEWYLVEAENGSGRDDGVGKTGTEPFITGGADAIQVRVTGDEDDLPAGLELSLLPANPEGEQELTEADIDVAAAGGTPVNEDSLASSQSQEPLLAPGSSTDSPDTVGAPDSNEDEAAAEAGQSDASGAMMARGSLAGAQLLPQLFPTATVSAALPVAVTSRAQWGADESIMDWDVEVFDAPFVIVHHTAGTNNYTKDQSASIVRGIYNYHATTLQWGDVGYNFLVDKWGRVFEGRSGSLSAPKGKMVQGGHAYGFNKGTMGIAMLGTYTSQAPSTETLTSVGKLAGWHLARAGVTDPASNGYYTHKAKTLPHILGHRDVNSTECPGNVGYTRLPQVRTIATTTAAGDSTKVLAPKAPPSTIPDLSNSGRWLQTLGLWQWVKSNGSVATSEWARINGAIYYFDDSGYMVTGWLAVGSSWYYFHPSGARASGWLKEAGSWYYLNTSTAVMQTGQARIGGRTYMFASSGALRTGWVSFSDGWRHYDASGNISSGWLKDAGSWYYLNPSTNVMTTGWLDDRGTWYWFNTSGAMVTGTVTIDGRVNRFDASGRWIGYADQHPIMAKPTASRASLISTMTSVYTRQGKAYPASVMRNGGAGNITTFVTILYDEAVAEGVSPELLFCQVMKETGWLQFGGDVKATQFNFGGIGAVGGGASGASFSSVRIGLRAQVQHLRAYADPQVSVDKLAYPLVDPRFTYVRKGSAPYVEYLGIQENPSGAGWAAAKNYGYDLVSMMALYF